MILVVTPNLAWDVTYAVDRLVPHRTHRVRSVRGRAGGKGVNVARVLGRLGRRAVVAGLAGGRTGELIRQDLLDSGIDADIAAVREESRRTVAVVSTADGEATLFNEPGPVVGPAEWTGFREAVLARIPEASAVVLTGSLPPGVPDDSKVPFIHRATASGVPCIVDTSGPALRHAVKSRPALVKPNAEELRELTSRPDPLRAAVDLRDEHGVDVVVSLGAEGLVAATGRGVWRARPGEPVRGNPTGAGDAVVAALVSGHVDGTPWPHRLAEAVAISAAAVAAPVAGEFDADEYRRQRDTVRVHPPEVLDGT
ncbi:1-phosphofructokinase family hexose kinase [Saccharopolyspora rosea]